MMLDELITKLSEIKERVGNRIVMALDDENNCLDIVNVTINDGDNGEKDGGEILLISVLAE